MSSTPATKPIASHPLDQNSVAVLKAAQEADKPIPRMTLAQALTTAKSFFTKVQKAEGKSKISPTVQYKPKPDTVQEAFAAIDHLHQCYLQQKFKRIELHEALSFSLALVETLTARISGLERDNTQVRNNDPSQAEVVQLVAIYKGDIVKRSSNGAKGRQFRLAKLEKQKAVRFASSLCSCVLTSFCLVVLCFSCSETRCCNGTGGLHQSVCQGAQDRHPGSRDHHSPRCAQGQGRRVQNGLHRRRQDRRC
jgi:hypothetical protein